jgi:N-methylhydantoinase B
VRITIKGDKANIDFTGSATQVAGSINAVEAITVSAVSYVFRCLINGEVPASAGLMEPIAVLAPPGTVVNANPPAAVAGGNVETSQRIVDVLFKALAQALPDRIPAASQGTMNNLTVGGIDPVTAKSFPTIDDRGGMGARPALAGMSGVHTHMTNSLNTPAEALEYSYPLRVREYSCVDQAERGSSVAVMEWYVKLKFSHQLECHCWRIDASAGLMDSKAARKGRRGWVKSSAMDKLRRSHRRAVGS